MELLRQLTEARGVPGREERVRELIIEKVKDFVDFYEVDPMGNLICYKGQDASKKTVMIACHMDEIGFYVRHIDDNGFLKLQPVGGFDVRNLFSRRVVVDTKSGPLTGVMAPGKPPIHMASDEDKRKNPEIKEFYVDLGLPAKEVKELVCIGDPVTLWQTFTTLGNHLTCKAMDNRVACWTGINLLKQLKNWMVNVAVAFTVQEEVGVRGAMTCAYKISPDYAIAIDTTLACDTPGIASDLYISELGKGTCIKIMDSFSISDRGLVDRFIEIAKKENITYQLEILPLGGTDAAGAQRAGVGCKAITLSVPTRYIHTTCETIHWQDLQDTLSLLRHFCEQGR